MIDFAVILVHACVIGKHADAVSRKQRGGFDGLAARQAIDDAALPRMAADKFAKLRLPCLLVGDRQADVRPVEAKHELRNLVREQPGRDVFARHFIGGRRQRGDGRVRKQFRQSRQVLVFRPERRPPLRDAVRFVNGDETHRQCLQTVEHRLAHQALGREVEELRFALGDSLPRIVVVLPTVARVDAVSRNTSELERRDLILHKRDERRDDHRKAFFDKCWHLKAHRFARPCRHDDERVLPRKQGINRCLLTWAERLKAEGFLQHLLGQALQRCFVQCRAHGYVFSPAGFLSDYIAVLLSLAKFGALHT